MRILIGGDILPTENDEESFASGDVFQLIDENIYDLLNSSDVKIYDLEAVLTDSDEAIIKAGPSLKCDKTSINGITSLCPSILIGANNHAMDYGLRGIIDTRELLCVNRIDYLGVGANIFEARSCSSICLECKGIRIGVYCCAENEFSCADSYSVNGANQFDPYRSFDDVSLLGKDCDYTIVIYHGGLEYYRYPTPNLQRTFRRFAEHGADLVIAQHGHCVACEEEYKDSRLIYGQGNFIYKNTVYDNSGSFSDGLLIEVNITSTERSIRYHPIINGTDRTRLAEGVEYDAIFNGFRQRSDDIKDGNTLAYIFKWEARKRYEGIHGLNRIDDQLRILNNMQCESLRELAICAYNLSFGKGVQSFIHIVPNEKLESFVEEHKTISVYGAGRGFDHFAEWIRSKNAEIGSVYDKDIGRKKTICGVEYRTKAIIECKTSEIIIICTGVSFEREIYEELIKLGLYKVYAIGDIWSLN